MTNTHAPMNDTLQYWMYLTITPGGTLRTRKHTSAHTYFQETLSHTVPDLANSPTFPHRKLQRQLIEEKAEGSWAATEQGSRAAEEQRKTDPESKIVRLRRSAIAQSNRTHDDGQNPKSKIQNSAEACLRCFISHQIDYACQQLASQFGTNHRFGKMDILPFILNDNHLLQKADGRRQPVLSDAEGKAEEGRQKRELGRGVEGGGVERVETGPMPNAQRPTPVQNPKSKIQNPKSPYLSLSTEILDTFNPDRSNLKTWTVRLVRHNPIVTSILLDHGVYLVSDWAILNDTTEPQLERILGEFYMLSSGEIHQFVLLLESFHAIYRGDRCSATANHHRQPHQTSRCLPPTPDQLTRISQYIQDLWEQGEDISDSALKKEGVRKITPKQILPHLQALAHYLRDYRIHIRRGTLPNDSIDNFESPYWESRLIDDSNPLDDQDEASQRFLSDYRQAFEESLDAAIQMVVEQKVARLRKRKGDRHRLFLKGLHLFHCQGQTMTEIAPQLGYERQDKVTYLLKLKDLRADIRHETLNQLRDRILSLAQAFADPAHLQQLDQQLDTLLEEPLTALMAEAELETTGPRDGPLKSRFSRRLCCYLGNQYPDLNKS